MCTQAHTHRSNQRIQIFLKVNLFIFKICFSKSETLDSKSACLCYNCVALNSLNMGHAKIEHAPLSIYVAHSNFYPTLHFTECNFVNMPEAIQNLYFNLCLGFPHSLLQS